MADTNVLVLSGRIGGVPELKDAGSSKVLKFTLANGYYAGKGKGQDGGDYGTMWFNVDIFGKRAEALASILQKGAKVIVTGSFTAREFARKDGSKGISLDINANEVNLLEKVEKAAEQATSASVDDSAIPF